MARKKKRKRRPLEPKKAGNEPGIFNPAFDGLLSLKREDLSQPEKQVNLEPSETKREPDEARDFLKAMLDVEPLPGGKKRVVRMPNLNVKPAHSVRNDELETMTHLFDLVSGIAEMDVTCSDEYIEGCVHGFSRKLMDRLRKGEFPVQEHLDLHGLTKPEAEAKVRGFLLQSHQLGLRCVLLIHGRGLNSEDHIPVLKERLPVWLSRGPVRKIVLAFSTARPYDGGTGAVYVLLKRQKGKARFRLNTPI